MTKNNTKIRTLEPEEFARFMSVIPRKAYGESSTRNYAFFWLLAVTGMRVGEGCFLRMDDLHLEEPKHLITPFEGKTGKRYLPIPEEPEALKALDAWLAIRAEKYPDSPYVFVTREGHPMDVSNPERAMRTYAKKAGIKRIQMTPHVLRHTYASKFLNHSGNLRQLQVLLGHKNIETTTIYLQVANPELQRAVKGMHW